jgi:hypothetical protein
MILQKYADGLTGANQAELLECMKSISPGMSKIQVSELKENWKNYLLSSI